MPRQEKIRAQTTPEDGVLFEAGFNSSMFRPMNHGAFSDFVREKRDLEHQDQVMGRKLIFDIEKQATFIEDLNLRVTLPALEVPDDGTYIRYADFPLWQAIEKITLRYTSNTLAEYDSDWVYSQYRYDTDEHQRCTELQSNGNLTAAQRNTLAVNSQVVRMRLPTPWLEKQCQNPMISALANKLRFEIQLRPARDIIQTDGTKPSSLTLSGIALEQQFLHVTGGERAEATAYTLRPDGLSYLFEEQQAVHKTIPANALGGASGYVIELNDLDGPISFISALVRRSADLDGNNDNPNYYEIDASLVEDWSYRMTSNGQSFFESTEVQQELPYYTRKYRPCGPGTEQIVLFWNEMPERKLLATGHLSFGNVSNPKFIINADSANTEDLTLTLIPRRWNWLNHQAGNLQKIWN